MSPLFSDKDGGLPSKTEWPAGDYPVSKPLPRMTREELASFLHFVLTHPRESEVDPGNSLFPHTIVNWLDEESKRHGYRDWREAYQGLMEGEG